MAKVSAIAKNNRRKKMAAKGEVKRAELRAKLLDENLSEEEFMTLQNQREWTQDQVIIRWLKKF